MNVSNEKILKIESISKEFYETKALENVSLDIYKGEILAVVGENGAGKSTLMKIIAGVYPNSSYKGKIFLKNNSRGDFQECRFKNARDSQNAGIAIIHQELNLVPKMSVAENIFLGREPSSFGFIRKKEIQKKVRELIDTLDFDVDIDVPVECLSLGVQQMIEIAKSLLINSEILILDEPTSSLTEHETKRLFEILRCLKDRGVTCIYISHKLEEVFEIADRVCVLRDGKLVGELYRDDMNREKIISMMVGRNIFDMYPKEIGNLGDNIFEVKYLSIYSKTNKKSIIDNVSFNVRAGEVLGFAGLIGAGRTELVMSIFGAYSVGRIKGEIILDGEHILPSKPKEAINLGIALVTEDRKKYGLIPEQNVLENISIASLERFSNVGFISHKKELDAVSDKVEQLKIKTASLRSFVKNLSGGNQQKVILARWLMNEPKLLILDEPTRGIDIGAKVEVYKLINQLAAKGIAILLVSSDLPEVIGMSDRILVMHEGKIKGEFAKEVATQEKIMHVATGGK